MSTIAHEIIPLWVNEKTKTRLKIICQDWTKASEDIYIVHHSSELILECPVCNGEYKQYE